jgi:eukaryotic-like serine/threonine-protein kinase
MMASSFAPGHEFAGRYRLIELIGVGHTVEVYRAEDLTLQRDVVVKVLLAHLAEHEEVRRAFRDHIIQSAAYRHPHVARVFDGGQQSGFIFMVGEYLPGGSLEDLLRAGAVLSVEETARLGRDASSALAYIHEHGVVHGELSPSKILFDESGHLRVSDVALAGLAGPHRHYTTRDDVRYFSPEQARGDIATAASDVYALGLILFETATGTTPFEGSTAEAMLRERMNGPLPSRPELGGFDILLAHVTVPDALVRLTAEELAQRLSGFVPDEGPFVKYDEPTPSLLGGFTLAEPRQSVGFRPPSPNQIVSSPRSSSTFGSSPSGRHPAPPRRSAPGNFEDLAPISGGRRRPLYLIAAFLVVVLAVGGGLAWKLGFFSSPHTAPALSGLTLAEASTLVKNDGFTLNVTAHVASATVSAGDIVSQSPAAGTSVAAGSTLSVTVSSGPPVAPVTLPTTLVGMTCAAATSTLATLHVTATCPASASIPSSTVAVGLVAGWLSGTTKNPVAVPKGSSLVLETSSGPSGTTATTTTAPAGTTTTSPTTTTTSPAATTTTTTSPTTTTTAKTLTMPNLVGKNQSQVAALMKAAGLYYSTQGPGAGPHPTWTRVVSTVPAAGVTVPYLSTVRLNVTK